MMASVQAFGSLGLGGEVGLIHGGNILCLGGRGDVRFDAEGFNKPRSEHLIQRVEIRGLVECEDNRGLV